MPYTALLSFIRRRLFASAPAEGLPATVSEDVAASPMSDRELSRTIKELRDSPVAGGAFRRGKASGRREPK
ncbi:hypothetical protein [Bradyrhizobium sp. SYSU BS000235]|uniref:hypothetical protein n=1 Tax=Bradyrhizobium sp. SYSU BS000235 TaxID=3411332 RepID=UPI003C78C773